MKAYLLDKIGESNVLKPSNLLPPEPEVKDKRWVRIQVDYISVNYADILARKGLYGWAPKRPYIPGLEGLGRVKEIGENVTKVSIDDLVIFGAQCGGYAEEIIVSDFMTFKVFQHLSPEENASILVNYMTVWLGLFSNEPIKTYR